MGITDGLPFYFERSRSGSSCPVSFDIARDSEGMLLSQLPEPTLNLLKRSIIFKTF